MAIATVFNRAVILPKVRGMGDWNMLHWSTDCTGKRRSSLAGSGLDDTRSFRCRACTMYGICRPESGAVEQSTAHQDAMLSLSLSLFACMHLFVCVGLSSRCLSARLDRMPGNNTSLMPSLARSCPA